MQKPLAIKQGRIHMQLVIKGIQGSHMVSSNQRPGGSDPVKKWSESRAAASKGQYPVEHRGEFSDVLISGLESRTKAWGEDLGFGEQIEYMEG